MTRSRSKQVAAESTWVMASNLVVALIGLGGVALLTDVLSKEQFGRFSLSLTIVGFAQQLMYGPVSTAALRLATVLDPSARAIRGGLAIAARRFRQSMIGLAVVIPVLLVAASSGWAIIAAAAMGYAWLAGSAVIIRAEPRSRRQRPLVAVLDVTATALRWGSPILFAIVFASAEAAMVGLLVAGLADRAAHLRVQRNAVGADIHNQRDIADLRTFAKPFSVLGLAVWLRIATERWALEGFEGTEDVADYAALVMLVGRPIEIASAALSQLLGPIVFARAADLRHSQRVDDSIRLNLLTVWATLGIGLLGCTVPLLIGDELVAFVLGDEFSVGSFLPTVVALAGVFWAAGHLSGLILVTNLRPTRLYVPNVSAQTVGVVGSLIGAAQWGVNGVAVAAALSGAVFAILSLRLAHRQAHSVDL